MIRQWPAPADTHTQKVQVGDGLLLTNDGQFPFGGEPDDGEHRGVVVYSLDDPFAHVVSAPGAAVGAGRTVSSIQEGVTPTCRPRPPDSLIGIWVVLDLADPALPVEVARWWWPGQGPGELRIWPDGERYAAHHALIDGDHSFLGYDNPVVLDVADRARPRRAATYFNVGLPSAIPRTRSPQLRSPTGSPAPRAAGGRADQRPAGRTKRAGPGQPSSRRRRVRAGARAGVGSTDARASTVSLPGDVMGRGFRLTRSRNPTCRPSADWPTEHVPRSATQR